MKKSKQCLLSLNTLNVSGVQWLCVCNVCSGDNELVQVDIMPVSLLGDQGVITQLEFLYIHCPVRLYSRYVITGAKSRMVTRLETLEKGLPWFSYRNRVDDSCCAPLITLTTMGPCKSM